MTRKTGARVRGWCWAARLVLPSVPVRPVLQFCNVLFQEPALDRIRIEDWGRLCVSHIFATHGLWRESVLATVNCGDDEYGLTARGGLLSFLKALECRRGQTVGSALVPGRIPAVPLVRNRRCGTALETSSESIEEEVHDTWPAGSFVGTCPSGLNTRSQRRPPGGLLA
jgi:hypothetical protein